MMSDVKNGTVQKYTIVISLGKLRDHVLQRLETMVK
jgi:hypothetical protein